MLNNQSTLLHFSMERCWKFRIHGRTFVVSIALDAVCILYDLQVVTFFGHPEVTMWLTGC